MTKKAVKKGKKQKKGNRYHCATCGLVVTVDETCGCEDTCDIVCCGEEMTCKK